MKLLGGDDAVKIVATENQTSFEIGKTRVITRLIEGEFPNYEDVIPKEKKEKAKVSTDLFLSATKRASLFTNPDSLAIKLELTKNKITVSKSAPYIGESKRGKTAVYSGKNLSIGFNPAYHRHTGHYQRQRG
jgi:DNA polymerase-3 subunit beta